MAKIATIAEIYTKCGVWISTTGTNRCPTKLECTNKGLTVSGSYNNNRLVQLQDISISSATLYFENFYPLADRWYSGEFADWSEPDENWYLIVDGMERGSFHYYYSDDDEYKSITLTTSQWNSIRQLIDEGCTPYLESEFSGALISIDRAFTFDDLTVFENLANGVNQTVNLISEYMNNGSGSGSGSDSDSGTTMKYKNLSVVIRVMGFDEITDGATVDIEPIQIELCNDVAGGTYKRFTQYITADYEFGGNTVINKGGWYMDYYNLDDCTISVSGTGHNNATGDVLIVVRDNYGTLLAPVITADSFMDGYVLTNNLHNLGGSTIYVDICASKDHVDMYESQWWYASDPWPVAYDINPDPDYLCCFRSDNQGVASSVCKMKIHFEGDRSNDSATTYIRSNGESNYDYVVISNLNASLPGTSSSYGNKTSVSSISGAKDWTKGSPSSGTAITSYKLVNYYPNAGDTIEVVYQKDSGVGSGDDTGYFVIHYY